MRKFFLLAAVSLFAGLATSCGDSFSEKEEAVLELTSKPDTTFTVVMVAMDYSQNQFATSMSMRVTAPKIDSAGTGIVLDTAYLIPVVDTVRDQYNRPMVDYTGKANLVTNWIPIGKAFVVTDYRKAVPVIQHQ